MSISNVGDGLKAEDAGWKFRDAVVKEFDTHVRRSVPYYESAQDLIMRISDFFISDSSLIYDIGTSTGEMALKLAERHKNRPDMRVIGIDIEQDMVARAESKRQDRNLDNVLFAVEDVVQSELQPCDLVVAFYTMQFIRPNARQTVFDKIYSNLNWGGAFLLFEKVRGEDARFQDILTSVYTDFKIDQGYSPAEIIGKSKSLKGVLEPFSSQGNLGLLGRAGFSDVMPVFRYACFEGVLAIK